MDVVEEALPRRDRGGGATRERIRRVALDLFTERGFEGTSVRDLADALGMTKSALYHHFPSKEAIVLDLLEQRQRDVDALWSWVQSQSPRRNLLADTVMRWLDTLSPEVMAGMRFARANAPTMRRLGSPSPNGPFGFDRIINALADSDEGRLCARIIFDSGAAALLAADGLDLAPEDVDRIVRQTVQRLLP